MPELPEVETVVRGLEKPLLGRRIERADVYSKKIRTPLPRGLSARIAGSRIVCVRRRAKYILLDLDNGRTIVIHLGMTGNIQLLGKGALGHRPGRHDHVLLHLAGRGPEGMLFSDPRRFGVFDLLETATIEEAKSFRDLGVEPLERQFTGEVLEELFAGRKTAVKLALMNQSLVVGVGNIYASEALFRAGISPLKPAFSVRGEKAENLCAAVKKVLSDAINAGGSTLRDYRHANGDIGFFQDRFSVYDREGEACPGCTGDLSRKGGVKRIVQGGRSTFYCPVKQR